MNLASLLYQLGLPGEKSAMIRNFVETNHIELNTFVIVSKKKMLETDLSPNNPHIEWIQSGELVEKDQINPNTFFFAIMDGCGVGKVIVVPDPA